MIPSTIRLHRLRVPARIGCTETERQHEQVIQINLELVVPSAHSAGREVDLSKSVCYLELRNKVRDLVKSQSWVLVEQLCSYVLDMIRNDYALVSSATVVCRKFVLADCDWSEVQLSQVYF